MPDLSGSLSLLEHFKGFQKDLPLAFPVSDLSYGSSVRILNGSRSRDADCPVKFIGGREDDG
jgi:hypothetical protein